MESMNVADAFRMQNATASVNDECVRSKAPDLQWMCFFADYSVSPNAVPALVLGYHRLLA